MNQTISWTRFVDLHSDPQKEFENLSRLIFKRFFIKDPCTLLTAKFNNPGIECEPIEVN